jgi:hypothetical protein
VVNLPSTLRELATEAAAATSTLSERWNVSGTDGDRVGYPARTGPIQVGPCSAVLFLAIIRAALVACVVSPDET